MNFGTHDEAMNSSLPLDIRVSGSRRLTDVGIIFMILLG